MQTIIVSIIIISTIAYLSYVAYRILKIRRVEKHEKDVALRIKYWKQGDWLQLHKISTTDEAFNATLKEQDGYVELFAYTEDEVLVRLKGDTIRRLNMNLVKENVNAGWRKLNDDIKKTMGQDAPQVNSSLWKPKKNQDSKGEPKVFEGKLIETMSEIECNVYLKMAIESENYEVADRIRKQLEKFR